MSAKLPLSKPLPDAERPRRTIDARLRLGLEFMKAPDRHILALKPAYRTKRTIHFSPHYPVNAPTRYNDISRHCLLIPFRAPS